MANGATTTDLPAQHGSPTAEPPTQAPLTKAPQGDDAGFSAVSRACEKLVSSAQGQMGMQDKSAGATGIDFEYSLGLQLAARLNTDWKVTDGFTLRSITLRLDVQLATGADPAFQISLEADGRIGDVEFYVSASIPHLQRDVPLDLDFFLSLRSAVTPDQLWKNVEFISGGSSGAAPSRMVDGPLRDGMQSPLFEASLALRFRKPVNEAFGFVYCSFNFGGQINYEPKIESPKIKVVDGAFSLLLVKSKDPAGKTQYNARAELHGRVAVSQTLLSVAVTFSRIEQAITVGLRVWNANPYSASRFERISPDRFCRSILPSKDQSADSLSGMVGLPSAPGLDMLRHDLKRPNLRFMLFVDVGSQGLNELLVQVYARQLCTIQADFLKGAVIRNLVVNVNLRPKDDSRMVVISGMLELDLWRFRAALNYEKKDQKSLVRLKASLDRSTAGNCSVVALAKSPMLSLDESNQNTDSQSLEKYIDDHSVPSDSGLSLGLAKYNTFSADMSFEIVLSKDATAPDTRQAASGKEQPVDGKDQKGVKDPKEPKDPKAETLAGYQLDLVKLRAHFGLSWAIIPGHMNLEDLGLAFTMAKSTKAGKQTAGYIYGEWKIEKFTLWTYIVGEKTADASTFVIGLNIKTTADPKGATTLAAVLADPKLADSVGMPQLDLPFDVVASPQKQELSTGLALDGHLRVRLTKLAAKEGEKQAWKMKEIMVRIVLETDFQLFGDKALAKGYIDLRIVDPMEKNKRIQCCLIGYLQVGALQILIAAMIKVKSGEVKAIEDTSEKSKQITEAQKHVASKKPPQAPEDKEDLRFVATVRYTKSQGQNVKVEDVLKELASPSDAVTAADQKYIPSETGWDASKFAQALDFYVDVHVGKKTSDSTRTLKSLTLTVSLSGPWTIIDKVLTVSDAGLRLMLLEAQGDKPKRKIFMVYGTLSLFDARAVSPMAVYYESGTVSFGLVVVISLNKLLGGFKESDTIPPLIEEQEKAAPSGVIAAVTGTVKDKKFDSFDVSIRSVGEIPVAGTFTIDQCIIAYSKAAGSNDKSLLLTGRLNWGKPENRQSLSATAKFSQKQITLEFALNKAPGKMLDDFLGSEAPSKADRPELPSAMGFADWDSDNYSKGDKTTIVSQLLFEQLEASKGRQFKSIVFALKLAKDWKWSVIDDWFWFTDLQFKLVYLVPTKALAIQLEVKLNFMRHPSSGESDRTTAVDIPDSIDIALTATKTELKLEIPESKVKDCNSTDLIYCLTAGYIKVPHALGIPMFPRVVATLSWKEDRATVQGHLTKKDQHWEFSKAIGSILRMENPMLEGKLSYGKRKDKPAASLKGEAVILSKIRISIEYVLPKGPLLVEGYDIKAIVDMVKRLWDLAQKIWKVGKTLFEIAEAIGSFIASVAIAAEAFVDGLLVVGGLIAGWFWSKLKDDMIDAFRKLFSSDKDKDDAEAGLRHGAKKHEKEDVSKSDPKDKHDDPSKPVDPDGPRGPNDPPSSSTTATEKLQIRGTGSSSGICGEAVQIFVVPRATVDPTGKAEPEDIAVTFYLNDAEVGTKRTVAGYPVRLTYRRPKTEGDYRIKISAKGTAAEPVVKELQLSARARRPICLSELKSKLLLPTGITAGVPFAATLILRDTHGNIVDGYDDRKMLVVDVDSNSHPRVFVRRNGYILHFPPLKKGKHTFVARVDGRQIAQFEVIPVPKLNPKTVSVRGRGVCNGTAGESCDVFVRCLDHAGEVLESAAVAMKMTAGATQTPIDFKFNQTTGVYTATYQRPSQLGEYRLDITANGEPIGGSPLTLRVHDYVDISRTQISVLDPKPKSRGQSAVVEIFDFTGSRWRLSSAAFAGAKLRCRMEGSAGTEVAYERLVDNEDGTYSAQVSLQRSQTWHVSLELPDGRKSPEKPIAIPDQTVATQVFASGDGLQTGYEGTLAVIDMFGFNDKGQAAVLKSNVITAFIVHVQANGASVPVSATVRDSKVYYERPKSSGTNDQATIDDAAHVYVRIFYRSVEAYGSPFHVVSVPYFVDVQPQACQLVQVPISIPHPATQPRRVGLVLEDNFGYMMTAESNVTVRESKGGKALTWRFLPYGIYELDYGDLGSGVALDVLLDGKKISTVSNVAVTTFSTEAKPVDTLAGPFSVAYQFASSTPIAATDLQPLLYSLSTLGDGTSPPSYFQRSFKTAIDGRNLVTFSVPQETQSPSGSISKWYAFAVKFRHLPVEPTDKAASTSLVLKRSLLGASADVPPPIKATPLLEEGSDDEDGDSEGGDEEDVVPVS